MKFIAAMRKIVNRVQSACDFHIRNILQGQQFIKGNARLPSAEICFDERGANIENVVACDRDHQASTDDYINFIIY